jgi:hypothetical protein
MDNKEFYKKRLKIAQKNVQESPFYTVPSWPVRKVVGLLGLGIAKLTSIKVEKPPIARFVEYGKDNKKKISGRERLLNYDDVLDGVLQKMSDAKDPLNQSKSKFDNKYLKKTGIENIKNLINEEISEILNRDNKPENQLPGSHFVDESNERVKISNKGIIDYNTKTNNEKTRVAKQISYFVQKYLEKKPEDKQFIEREDLEGPDNTPGPLKKYLEDRIKRDELSYIKALLIPAIATIPGVVTLAVAFMYPIGLGLGIGIGLVVLGVVSAISVLVYKKKEMSVDKLTQTIQQEDQDRFKQLEQEVEQEKIRRQEEKERGKTSTGENPAQNANERPEIPILEGIQPHRAGNQDPNNPNPQSHQEQLNRKNQRNSQPGPSP